MSFRFWILDFGTLLNWVSFTIEPRKVGSAHHPLNPPPPPEPRFLPQFNGGQSPPYPLRNFPPLLFPAIDRPTEARPNQLTLLVHPITPPPIHSLHSPCSELR
ncbi:hypothetical protein [Nodosilinea sp. PGN35]|uniref:hypothetical protein n=1 Tax=Nodosilinea sp. PGN35 TaxID=3020489 RepID=UPI00398A9207